MEQFSTENVKVYNCNTQPEDMFDLLHCQINENILLMQVNNANILKTIGMLYNAILL